MKAKQKRGPRGPYRCTRCEKFGHRADRCTAPIDINETRNLRGEIALRSMLNDDLAVHVVIAGSVQDGLMAALQSAPDVGTGLVNAYRELAAREAKLSPGALARAREAKRKLDLAWAEYAEAVQPIRAALKPHTKET